MTHEMIRINVFITSEQRDWLKIHAPLNLSEHIRRAIDERIEKIDSERNSSSLSGKAGV